MTYPFIIVGLGNPGQKYANNRHNVGWMVLDRLWEVENGLPWQRGFQGKIAYANAKYLLKPETMMNSSGDSVGEFARFYKVHTDKIIVIHDDLDLPTGKVKVKMGGGHGGHNGLKSVDANISKDYWRVRVGIGRPEHKGQVLDYVLGDFTEDEMKIQNVTINAIVECFPMLLDGDDNGFMNKVALLTNGSNDGKPT